MYIYGRRQKVLFETGCERAFVSEDLDHNAEFVDEPLDIYMIDVPQGGIKRDAVVANRGTTAAVGKKRLFCDQKFGASRGCF